MLRILLNEFAKLIFIHHPLLFHIALLYEAVLE